MLTIACVLRSGPEYRPEHVAALRDGVSKHLTLPHRFVCLSDAPVPCERIPLIHKWPGYFAKLELFRPGIFDGPVFYIDLDSLLVGSLDAVVGAEHRFTMLRDFYWPECPASGVMAWSVDLSGIYRSFVRNSEPNRRANITRGTAGDQGVIALRTPVAPEFFQDRFPGQMISYKVHVRKAQHERESGNGSVPSGAVICCYHGKPRPWSTDLWAA